MTPHPHLPFFTLQLTSHGVLFALAAEVSGLLIYKRAQAAGLNEALAWPLTASCFLAGLIGARITFALLYWDQVGSFREFISFWHGGLVSYGGVVGGVVAALVVLRKQEISKWADAALPALLVGWGIGRIGNFLAGDSVGVRSTLFSETYARVPIQLFEAALCWLIAAALWRRPKIAWIAAVLYFAGRTIIDIWRDEPRIVGVHPSSVTSFVLCTLCLLIYVLGSARRTI